MNQHIVSESLVGFPLRPRIESECLCGAWSTTYQLPWFPDEAAWYLAGYEIGQRYDRHVEEASQ